MPGKLSLPEPFNPQISAEALAAGFAHHAFHWLVEQEDLVFKLLICMREKPVVATNIDDVLCDRLMKQHIADTVVFGGKAHLALTSIGEFALRRIETFGECFVRVFKPKVDIESVLKDLKDDTRRNPENS